MGQTRGAVHRIGRPLYPRALGERWSLRGGAVGGGRRGVAEMRQGLGGALRGRRMGRERVGRTRATFFGGCEMWKLGLEVGAEEKREGGEEGRRGTTKWIGDVPLAGL